MSTVLTLLLPIFAFAFIPTSLERAEHALKTGFSHEPFRTEYIVLHWDFSVSKEELEKVRVAMPRIVRMDWNRHVHARLDSLMPQYILHLKEEKRYKRCVEACRNEAPFNFPLHLTSLRSLLMQCVEKNCVESVEGEEVKEYRRLKQLGAPKFDRMMIGNYIE